MFFYPHFVRRKKSRFAVDLFFCSHCVRNSDLCCRYDRFVFLLTLCAQKKAEICCWCSLALFVLFWSFFSLPAGVRDVRDGPEPSEVSLPHEPRYPRRPRGAAHVHQPWRWVEPADFSCRSAVHEIGICDGDVHVFAFFFVQKAVFFVPKRRARDRDLWLGCVRFCLFFCSKNRRAIRSDFLVQTHTLKF